MFETLVPNFAGEEASIHFIANAGYTLVINLQNLTPQYYRSTFPEEWQNKYIENRFALIDPVLYWAAWNTGRTRWSDIKLARTVALNDHVLKTASEYDLNYGATFAYRTGRKRSSKNIFSIARNDRDFNDQELDFLEGCFNRILGYIGQQTPLSEGEIQVLEGAARGLTQQEIADQAKISKDAVKKRMEKARHTLGATTATQAVAIAAARNLITL